MENVYEYAKEAYAKQGIDTDAVLDKLAGKAISVNCWQGDDVVGFDQGDDNAASGGIMTTGNYLGRAHRRRRVEQPHHRGDGYRRQDRRDGKAPACLRHQGDHPLGQDRNLPRLFQQLKEKICTGISISGNPANRMATRSVDIEGYTGDTPA